MSVGSLGFDMKLGAELGSTAGSGSGIGEGESLKLEKMGADASGGGVRGFSVHVGCGCG
jgi:hypothetical protein